MTTRADFDYFIEATTKQGYLVVWRGEGDSAQKALNELVQHPSTNKLELWTKAHAQTDKGFAPLAWKENGKVFVTHTFTFIHLGLTGVFA
jgi:hypothetical protein